MITQTQQRVLKAIEALIKEKGCAPTYGLISTVTGHHSLSTIHKHVHALAKKGYLVLDNCSRIEAVIPAGARNGLRWKECSVHHPAILHQCEKCPVCECCGNGGNTT